jgi:hypothetical protein
LEKLL